MKITKSFLTLLLSIILGVFLVSYVLKKYPLGEVFTALSNVTPGLLLLYSLVSCLIMVVFTIRWKILLEAQGYHGIPVFDLFSYRVIDYGVSYLTPTAKIAGEPVRAAMLMRNGISFKEGLTTITIDKTIELSFTIVMFVVGCFLLVLSNALSGGPAVFLLMLCCFLIFLNWTFYNRILRGKPIFISLFRFFNLDKIKRLARHQQSIIDFERPILKFYNQERRAYFIALGLTILAFALSMVEYTLLLKMVGVEPNLKETFMVFSVVGMAFLVPVPMGLGSLEAMQAWLFAALGFSSAAGVGLAVITRGRDLMWVFLAIAGAIYFGSLKKVLSEAFNAHYSNPVVKMTVFRGGRPEYLKVRMFRHRPASEAEQSDGLSRKPAFLDSLFRKKNGPLKFKIKHKK